MKLIYLDTETTGTDPQKHSIVQIAGVIRVGQEERDFNYLMAPWPGREIDPEALELQGRTVEQIMGYPSPAVVFRDFVALLGSYVDRYAKTDKFFMLAYNAKFDEGFVRAWFDAMGDKYYGSWFWTPVLDVMQAAAFHLMPRRAALPNFQLATVYEAITGKKLEDAHDAKGDILATQEIARKVAPAFVEARKE